MNLPMPRAMRSSSTSKIRTSPGITCRRKRALSMPAKKNSVSAPEHPIVRYARRQAACAIASITSTPGITGCPGKWPAKNGSFIVTFFCARSDLPGAQASTRSTSRNG
jgi:hypothetical protein